MTAIFKREFRTHFHSVSAYAVLGVLLLFSGVLVVYYGFIFEMPSLSYVLSDLMPVAALLCPVLTYKVMADERIKGTSALLNSLPVSSFDVVLGKYLAVMSVYAIQTLVLALVPLIYNYFGKFALGASYAALLAYFLFCASLAAINLFFSGILSKPAFILAASYGYAVVMYLLEIVSLFVKKQDLLFGILPKAFYFVGIFNRFEAFVYGMFDLGAIVYYISISLLFLYLTTRSFEKRRLGGEEI